MHFGHQNPKHTYHLNNHQLEVTHAEKDLGVIMDDTFKFHTHSSSASKKANQILGIIKRSYGTRDAITMTALYKAMVRPHLEYGNTIWGPFYEGDIKMVESIQRRATKMITGLHDKPYEERLKELKLPSLVYRRRRGDMIQMYKVINGLVRINVGDLFTSAKVSHTRGHPQRVYKTRAIKLPRRNSFSQRVINDWNGLPNYVVNAPSLNSFKGSLDKFWSDIKFSTTE